ncbi:lipopolysaccharide biosynthesis protein [Pseudonocardia nigra]|uniref:lipopolysaccharide biosynthesis protein n=1 Tax=Pseudonocardia nigra TaxID=1921578 RepID=UPI001C5D7D2F|nr:hypothetical protein [Pseudonocardia nigra]
MRPRHPTPGHRSAIVRPGHDGRPHPDPRADPPTEVLDPAGAPTVRLRAVVADTVRIPAVQRGGAPTDDTGNAGLNDGLALSLSSLLNSVAGFLFWIIAARLMVPAVVGEAQLVVNALILVGGAAQLNLGIGLMRWLPGAGRHTTRLIWTSLLLIMPLSGLVGLVYALVVPQLAEISAGPDGPFGLGLLLFVLGCAGWGVFVVHDFIVVALGKAWWAVWRNGFFAAARLGLLVVLAGVAGLGSYGAALSWLVPIVVFVAAGSAVIALLARRVTRDAPAGTVPTRKEALAFLGPTAVGQMGGVLLYNQVPLLLNLRFGTETGAVFFIVWQAVTVLDIAGMFFMNSLAVNVAREPHRAAELAAATRRRLLVIFLPALALGAALAHPLLLLFFGPAYAEADTVLQLLLLGLAFRLVVLHELGVRQAVGQAMGYARLQLVSTVLVLLVAAVVPVVGGGVSALVPVALGYIAVQVVCAAAVIFSPARRRAELEVPSR